MPKILVADDNTNIQKMVSLAFEERGIDVVSVGNGEAAVRRIPDVNPDLVLADIFMPVRNGYEVCEFVKKDTRFSHIPVILLVGAFDPLDEKEAKRVGADGVLKKPFVPPDPLIAMVISTLEKNPKVAAEMAKALEAATAPPPEPLPAVIEMPAKAEVKPLPDFPEPSPEEAALVYGFGSGKRGTQGVSEQDQGPLPPKSDGSEEDEQADDSASHNDWRRNAMDFEVPEETSKNTAFALDDETASLMFPSEKVVPPRRVPVMDFPESSQPAAEAAQEQAPAPSIAPASMAHDLQPEAELEIEHVPEPEAQGPAGHWMDSMAAMTGDERPHSEAPEIEAEPLEAAPAVSSYASQADELPVTEAGAEQASDEEDDSFFAEDASAQSADFSLAPNQDSHESDTDAALEDSGPVPVEGKVEPELEAEAEIAEPLGTDPELVGPAAVRVKPEPLLVNEGESAPSSASQYDKAAEDVASALSFLTPTENSEEHAVDERIPTGPPPNREALADIPFLTPPPEILEASRTSMDSSNGNSESVDDLVRKVLQRLEPQLHELLSQGVLKPLVENILQGELAKKDR